jgi:hypothetical protein
MTAVQLRHAAMSAALELFFLKHPRHRKGESKLLRVALRHV